MLLPAPLCGQVTALLGAPWDFLSCSLLVALEGTRHVVLDGGNPSAPPGMLPVSGTRGQEGSSHRSAAPSQLLPPSLRPSLTQWVLRLASGDHDGTAAVKTERAAWWQEPRAGEWVQGGPPAGSPASQRVETQTAVALTAATSSQARLEVLSARLLVVPELQGGPWLRETRLSLNGR